MAKEGLGNPIKIKPENKGKFTKYCKGLGELSVTEKCIAKGKASKNAKTRKRATFAANVRKFKK